MNFQDYTPDKKAFATLTFFISPHTHSHVCICALFSLFFCCFIHKKSSELVMAAPEGNFCRDSDNVWHRVGVFRERIASYAGVELCRYHTSCWFFVILTDSHFTAQSTLLLVVPSLHVARDSHPK